jgi:hypothetical protein
MVGLVMRRQSRLHAWRLAASGRIHGLVSLSFGEPAETPEREACDFPPETIRASGCSERGLGSLCYIPNYIHSSQLGRILSS